MDEPESYLAFIASIPRFRAAAGAILRDDQGRVLLVHPVYKEGWDIPGGLVEAGESPFAALVRELKEELAIVPTVTRLVCVDWVPPAPPWDAGLMFVFDAEVLTAAQIAEIRLPPEELERYLFVPPNDLEDVLVSPLLRRVRTALGAADVGGTVYSEDGIPRIHP